MPLGLTNESESGDVLTPSDGILNKNNTSSSSSASLESKKQEKEEPIILDKSIAQEKIPDTIQRDEPIAANDQIPVSGETATVQTPWYKSQAFIISASVMVGLVVLAIVVSLIVFFISKARGGGPKKASSINRSSSASSKLT